MNREEWLSYDATGLAQLVESGEITALELVERAIAQIEALEPTLHALAHRDFERARERATRPLTGAFAGVPFLLKDLLMYPGMRCAMGSRLFAGHVPQDPNPYCQQLDRLGLIVLGKTTTSEFGLLGSTETLLEGSTRNPWDLSRSATGSSGGAAVAVASGMVPFAHASDGGGSIRIPASACGLFGFLPSAGRMLPAGPGHPLFAPLLLEHCVSRSVRDSAAFLSWMEQADGALPRVGLIQAPLSESLRVGVQRKTLLGRDPDPGIASVLDKSIGLCRELGHEVVELEGLPLHGPRLSDAFFTLAGAAQRDICAMVEPMLGRPPGEEELEPFTLALLQWFQQQPPDAVETALESLQEARASMLEILGQYDVLLSPTSPIAAPALGSLSPSLEWELLRQRTDVLAGYTPIYNMTGAPAMSVPLFHTPEGLPTGSHFAAAPGREDTLLGLAYQLEEAHPWRHRRPDIAHNP